MEGEASQMRKEITSMLRLRYRQLLFMDTTIDCAGLMNQKVEYERVVYLVDAFLWDIGQEISIH
uniref:Uncharacterized protein n=1 Tax=Arundo donax TaxID=35708 RepID=A0A0A9CES1_ARUDO